MANGGKGTGMRGFSAAASTTIGNGIYNVHVEDTIGNGGVGVYTVTTGPSHPIGGGLNVLYGSGYPWSTFNTIRSYTSSTDHVQTVETDLISGNTVVSLDSFGTVTSLGSTGFRTIYELPGLPTTPDALTIITDVNVNGTTFENSTTVLDDTGTPKDDQT
jgi:hypothetical protein